MNREILKTAVKKAIDGGWNPGNIFDDHVRWKIRKDIWPFSDNHYTLDVYYEHPSVLDGEVDLESIRSKTLDANVIFNHDFAKALWGRTPMMRAVWQNQAAIYGSKANMEHWQYHLQQMVIADDPIRYLGENISPNND